MIIKALNTIYMNNELIWTLVNRDVQAKYKGSWLGIFWTMGNPIIMMIIYTFVFSSIFKARWGSVLNIGSAERPLAFAINLFTGLIVFNVFAECANRSSNLVTNNANYVKKIVFPIEILSTVITMSAMVNCISGLAILVVGKLVLYGEIKLTILLIPILWLTYMAMLVGMSWLVSTTGVFIRDIGQLMSSVVTVMMFMSPVFYPSSALPEKFLWISQINPIAYVIETTRKLLAVRRYQIWKPFILFDMYSRIV